MCYIVVTECASGYIPRYDHRRKFVNKLVGNARHIVYVGS